ncbi:aa3-type cytochrome oxidase subunit IV [Phaeacidiphilus oryzae]|uniref:aa3-type cytochrome oxidase subunit IV n=1 Tax=Phaeacidiphilus oryzae TaxID=348818 RepID=UPI00055F0290|nr:cytochrome c oxidase subunit 4 [Phaeacidiphilus oryzae]
MRTEARLFAVVAIFFAVAGGIYDAFAKEPAGKAALALCFLMSALISFFFYMQHRRLGGGRAQDRPDAEVTETAGPLEFFPPHSVYPVLAAAGFALLCLGVVLGLWLFLIGLGVVVAGVLGFVFQYNG